jgi:hypothetical protein
MERITPPDKSLLIRCPRLGHEIYFGYCRQENMGLPCFKILDCWFRYFAVEEYVRQNLSKEEWEQVFVQPGKPKMVALAEAIEAARKKPASS